MSGMAPCVNHWTPRVSPKSFMNKGNLFFFVHHLVFTIVPSPFFDWSSGLDSERTQGLGMVRATPTELEATIAVGFKLKSLLRCIFKKKVMGGCMSPRFPSILVELDSFWSFKMRTKEKGYRRTSTMMPDKLTQMITQSVIYLTKRGEGAAHPS